MDQPSGPRSPRYNGERVPLATAPWLTVPSTNEQTVPGIRHSISSPTTATPPRPLRHSNIGIQRLSSYTRLSQANAPNERLEQSGRRRSSSEPQRPQNVAVPGDGVSRHISASSPMPLVVEEPTYTSRRPANNASSARSQAPAGLAPPIPSGSRSRVNSGSSRRRSWLQWDRPNAVPENTPGQEYDSSVIDLLDVVDPEVSTLSTLTNVQNSLFVPDLGRFLNRKPTYELTRRPTDVPPQAKYPAKDHDQLPPIESEPDSREEFQVEGFKRESGQGQERKRTFSISSQLDYSHFAVLPHGMSLEGWSSEDIQELNDHVRHQLHSRRARWKRKMKAFGKYVRKPLGFFVTLYAFLITVFGLVWVLFLIGWISDGQRQPYVTNIVDNVLVALFAVVGDGLAPFRVVDTYHMCFIAHYHHLTWRLRRERAVGPLHNDNDLPAGPPPKTSANMDIDPEIPTSAEKFDETSMLTPKQQARLEHHQTKFSKSHTFYKPHETPTHHAFPLHFLVAAVVLLDCHSLFQIALGSFTWGWTYHTRPQWITAVILSMSITVNITAGIVISIGDRRTRKKEVIEHMFRQELTEKGIRKVKKKHTTAEGLGDEIGRGQRRNRLKKGASRLKSYSS